MQHGKALFVNEFSDEIRVALANFLISYSHLEHMLVLVCKRLTAQIDQVSLSEMLSLYSNNRRKLQDDLRKLLHHASSVPELLSTKQMVLDLLDEYAVIATNRHMACHGLWANFKVAGDDAVRRCQLQYGGVLYSPTAEALELLARRCTKLTYVLNGTVPPNERGSVNEASMVFPVSTANQTL